MLSHHEPVADQIVQGVGQARDLGAGLVARRHHLVLLALHHGACGRLGQEGERLGHDETEPGVQQGVPQAGAGRRRILLDGQYAGEAFSGRVPKLERLPSENGPDAIGGRAEVPEDQRSGRAATGQDQTHHLERV